MKPIETTRVISAPLHLVFATISDVRNFSKAVQHITNIEFLTDQQSGAGTRFLETRMMNGKEQTVELQVAECVHNEKVRMTSDAGGTVWDSVFTVKQRNDSEVEMKMVMDARAKHLVASFFNLLIRGMIAKAVESDMDAVKTYCESVS